MFILLSHYFTIITDNIVNLWAFGPEVFKLAQSALCKKRAGKKYSTFNPADAPHWKSQPEVRAKEATNKSES